MAWHVKKHGTGSKYEKIEDNDKFEWVCSFSFCNYLCDINIILFFMKVERVVNHQKLLLYEFKKNQRSNSIEPKRIIIPNKKSSPSSKKVCSYS